MVEGGLVHALGAETAGGMGTTVICSVNSMLVTAINITAATAVTHFSFFVIGSPDNEVTWFEYPCDLILLGSGLYTTGTMNATAKRNIVDDKANTTAEKYVGIIKHFPFKHARCQWIGTFTSITFAAYQQTK